MGYATPLGSIVLSQKKKRCDMDRLTDIIKKIAVVFMIEIVPPTLSLIIAFAIQYGVLKMMGIL